MPVYLFLNHAIRFIYVVGVVVAIEDINTRYCILVLDDSSGATIEVKIVRVDGNTAIHNVKTSVETPSARAGTGALKISIDGHQLNIGSVLKAKGTITTFRGQHQLELKRAYVIDTTDEARAWIRIAAFKREVLSKPWVLTPAEMRRVDQEVAQERQEEQERIKHAARRRERKRRWEERYERRRRQEEIEMNAGALI